MRVVMIGTGPFAVPTFRGIYDTTHTLVALVTSPLYPTRGQEKVSGTFCRNGPTTGHRPEVGRSVPGALHKRFLTPFPVLIREVAGERATPIFDPEDVNSPESRQQLRAYQADLLVTCDYGQILSAETLATSRLGGINLHASLLPKYRGAAPINWALYYGETQTGVSVIHMTPAIDAGPCIAQSAVAIGDDETAPQLEARLSELGAALVAQTIDALAAGPVQAIPQNPALGSKAPRLKKSDGGIDWSRPARAIRNQIRAFEPWPKCYTYWHREGALPLRCIIGPIQAVDTPCTGPPGTVLEAQRNRIVVATGAQAAALSEIQPAGKRAMTVEEFLRGYRVRLGERFGNDPREGKG